MEATATRWGGAPARAEDRSAEQQAIAARAAVPDRTAGWGLAAVLLLLGYEWLLSGLNKLLSAAFGGGLADQLRQASDGNPNRWYVRFLSAAVLPHAGAFAAAVAWGEVAVALGLAGGAVAWIGGGRLPARWGRRLQLATCVALLGSALMTANYYLLAGNGLPWLNPGAPFAEGLDIDGLLTLVALALLGLQLAVLRTEVRRGRSGDASVA
jgi:thiosulfate dehydrogenase [quinone] large subunit